jgi:SPX domain protein involved in polyphosphate accumulation
MGYETRFRHENKYEIDYGQYLCIRNRLRAICRPDPHARDDGTYLIRSIYFDNIDNKALTEKAVGKSSREKFRIRYYNDDLDYVTLEKKQKINDLCKKSECSLSKDEVCDILSGDTDFMTDHSAQLVRELYFAMTTQGLRPKVLVSYKREPYIYAPGNVRITFDSSIRTTVYSKDFLDNIHDISATDDAHMIIMEVKYDDYLPDIIKEAVNEGNIIQQSFSKYEACRRFG